MRTRIASRTMMSTVMQPQLEYVLQAQKLLQLGSILVGLFTLKERVSAIELHITIFTYI